MNYQYPMDVHEWNFDTVQSLRESEVEEDQHLEYKRQLEYEPDSGADDHIDKQLQSKWRTKLEQEFVAFANADGGIMLFGVKDKGEPRGIELPTHEPDQFISQLVANTDPLVRTTVGNPIPLSEGIERYILPVHVKEGVKKPVSTGKSAYYIRNNGRKDPMPKSLLESWFVDRDRRQQSIRRLSMEFDYFYEIYNSHFSGQAITTEPPQFELVDTDALRNVLRENTHLYSRQNMSDKIRSILQTIDEIDLHKRQYRRIITEKQENAYDTREELNRQSQRELNESVEELESKMSSLHEEIEK